MIKDARKFREQIRVLERKLGLLKKNGNFRGDGVPLTLTQCHSLVEIGRAKSISLKELAKILVLDMSTTSRTVDVLVRKKYVKRVASKEDRRSICISLTEDGNNVFNEIETENNQYFAEVFELIPSAKKQQVLESLDAILEALSADQGE